MAGSSRSLVCSCSFQENHSNPLTAMFHIASDDAIPTLPEHLSDMAKAFLSLCLVKSPRARSSATELLHHPFVSVVGNNLFGRQGTDRDAVSASSTDVQESDQRSRGFGSVYHQQAENADASRDESDEDSCASFSSDSGSPHSSASSDSFPDEEHSADYSSSEEEEESPSAHTEDGPSRLQIIGVVRAVADYATSDPNELSMTEGDSLHVLEMRSSGWWRGRQVQNGEVVGWFPCTYIEWISSDAGVTVKKTRIAEQEEELSVHEGEMVHIIGSEWRDGCLWARGSIPDGSTGWFPSESIMDA